MKNIKINLHMEQKRALGIMLIFALLFLMIDIFTVIVIKADCSQLSSLLRSKYLYSVTTVNSAFKDDYYQFDAGISYMVSEDAKKSLNAEILMQSAESDYTDLIDWNAEKLGLYEVAITEGLAQKCGIKIGDKIYSKHIVDGSVYEYTVEQIIPELMSARITSNRGYTNGIIIMGYDSQYIDNIAHRSIVFTGESIDELTTKVYETPENIVYRSEEMLIVALKILPYFLLFVLVFVLLASAQVIVIKKRVMYNFKRLIILGVEKKKLNLAYKRLVYFIGISSALIATVIAIAYAYLFVFSFVEMAILLVLTFIELVTLFISEMLSRRQMWR